MKKLKEQQKRFDDLKRQQEKVNDNTQKLQEQMNMMNRVNGVNSSGAPVNDGRSNITNILNKIKAQNAARKADDVINNNLSESSSDRVSVRSEEKDESLNESTEITLGSDGKPKKKKRGGKSTISIVTN